MRKNLCFLIVVFLLYLIPIKSYCQVNEFNIDRIDEEIEFDGKLEEQFWTSLYNFKTVQVFPNNGVASSNEEEIHLCYNKKYLYLGAKMYGDNIQFPTKIRDEFSLKSDYIGIILDSYLDKENAIAFFTTPAGLRTDFSIFEDAVGGFPVNLDWNTYWEVKVDRFEGGWSVEMRIPMSSLQFEDVNGKVKMGLIIWKATAINNEQCTWPPISNQWGDWSSFKPSQGKTIQMEGLKTTKPFYISPYILAGKNFDVNDPHENKWSNKLELGLYVKYNISTNITVDATVNTDFAQVEVDDQQINLSRFNLFFPEKRQFFQERASIFNLRVGGPNRFFYSRRIGLDDDGNVIPILGGARLTGRINDYDVGFINMTTRHPNWNPLTNYNVLRLRRKIFNAGSYIGFINTNKVTFGNSVNNVYALDGTFRFESNDILKLRLGQSISTGYTNKLLSLKPSRIFLNLEKINTFGIFYDLALSYVGVDYNPEMGFENRTNNLAVFAIAGYGWESPKESTLFSQSIRSRNFFYRNLIHQKIETMNILMSYNLGWKDGKVFNIFYKHNQEYLFDSFEPLEGLIIPAGRYRQNSMGLGFNSSQSGMISYGGNLGFGEYFGGSIINVSQYINWAVNGSVNIRLNYIFNTIFPNNYPFVDVYTPFLARAQFLYTATTKLFFSAYLQLTTSEKLALGNIRIRYNPREGVDLYLVYNNLSKVENINPNNGVQNQQFLTKFTYTFSLQ